MASLKAIQSRLLKHQRNNVEAKKIQSKDLPQR